MSAVLSIEQLLARVTARFAAENTDAVNLFGWKAKAQHVEGSRIVWTPGDPTGRVGSTLAPKQPGRHPRSLATLEELFTITITAADATQLDNEALQYRAAWLLRAAWQRAVYHAAHGTFRIVSERWLADRKERIYGASLEIVLALEAAILDVPLSSPPQTVQTHATRAEVDLTTSPDENAPAAITDVYEPAEDQEL